MAASGGEVDDVIRDLKRIPGFAAYAILNNDGIIIKYENMSYKDAVHHAHLVLSLCSKASRYMRDLLEAPDNEVESIRLRTNEYEMIIAQHANFTLIATQSPSKVEASKVGILGAILGEGDAKKEVAEEKKE